MPRNKKQKGPPARAHRPGPPPKGQAPSQSKPKTKGAGTTEAPQKKAPLQANQRPIVPFLRGDRVLLIGEGDFSFARSLATQYKCHKLYATCYDSQETLLSKYPQAEQNILDILNAPASKSKSRSKPEQEPEQEQEQEQEQVSDSKPSDEQQDAPKAAPASNPNGPKVLYSVDARKLGVSGGGGKEIKTGYPRKERKRPTWMIQKEQQERQKQEQNVRQLLRPEPEAKPAHSGPWDVICFNFPHVGGLSTDVNRQVRANQELLVAFFKACVPLLSSAPEPIDPDDDDWEEEDDDEDEDEDEDEEDEAQTSGKEIRTGPGQILVSLFEAEPYTLWNVKDLARHAGLQVVTSFRFPWASYEGYSHARTLGEVEGKNGGRGGWRGEDREARMYVFEVKKEPVKAGKQKRARTQDDSDDSE